MASRAPRRRLEQRTPDAVRYIVLRKLAPALRHMMMGELQTVEFTAELCSAMLRKGEDAAALGAQLTKLAEQTRAAAARCRDVTELLRPVESSALSVDEVVRHSIKLAGADWSLRGVSATLQASEAGAAAMVPTAIAREILVTTLLALVDLHASALNIVIATEVRNEAVAIRIEVTTPERRNSALLTQPREMLVWNDAVAIASAHGVSCVCHRDARSIELELPRVHYVSGS